MEDANSEHSFNTIHYMVSVMSSQEMDQVEGVVAAAAEESKEESRDTYDEKSLDSDVKGSEETATTEGEETNGAPESEGGEAEAEEKEQEGEEEEQEEQEEAAAAEADKNGDAEAADPAPATAAEEVNGNDRKRVSDAGDSAEAAEEIPCKKQKVDEEEATEADSAAEAVAAE